MRLQGRGIVITGASQGFGKAVAQACLSEGAHVLLCARNGEVLESAQQELSGQAATAQKVLAEQADVSDPEQVTRLIRRAIDELPGFCGVVNNAGVYGPKGLIEEVDWDDWSQAIAINLMGVVLVCRTVIPFFRQQGGGKIVNLSGGGATAPLPRLSAYAASKAAVVRFTETLAEETADAGIDVNSVAPGALNTRLLDEVLDAGPEKVGLSFYERAVRQKAEGGAPLEKGADLCVFLLSSLSNGITGRLLSAIWDPWDTLSDRRSELRKTDVYTLRRIVPKDRGLNWDVG
jgi:NAD(P)-dependent dehydrogenase (short-subunit alcohol dehydrogenase family)